MHSKVIITSLVCMLAASFNCGNKAAPTFAQKDEPVVEEMTCRAPNDYQKSVWISNETGNAGSSFNATISFEKEYSSFGILSRSSSLGVQYSFYGTYASVRITTPNSSGDYFVKFGYGYGSTQVVLATIYVCCNEGHYVTSYLSYDDARASYYRNYVASSSILSYISNRDTFNYKTGNYSVYNPARYSAEKNYSDYISGGRDDVEIEAVRTQKTNSNSSTKLILHANWIDTNGVSHPLVGVRADFILTNQLADSGNVHFTNSQGLYTVTLNQSVASQYSLNKIKCRLASVCKATAVEDRFCQNYPICYSLTSRLQLHTYSKVDYYFNIYAGTSDRADAYELTQIQTVPFNYVNNNAEMLDTIVTRFPAEHTDYHDSRHRDYFIDVQKEDAGSWDVLNHEYGHYICDKLGLARIDENRYPHNVDTPFEDDYYYLAYSEGLATYLGIAAQMYSSSAYNIPGYADEIYDDPLRDLSVNYSQFKPTINSSSTYFYAERTESSITSFLLKMLDDVARTGDDVMLGHSNMWNVLYYLSLDDPCDSIIKFIDKAIELYPYAASAINLLKENEGIVDCFVSYSDRADWTIMIYMNGCNLESGGKYPDGSWIDEDPKGFATINLYELSTAIQDDERVNIIVETGGAERWLDPRIDANHICRFEVGSSYSLNRVATLPNASMGDESTFESFLDWGLTEYPAKRIGVVMWGHGSDLGGVCGLKPNYVAQACHNVFSTVGVQKLDFIYYDACGCAIQDAAEFNSPYFRYMVASQMNVNEWGGDYAGWIDNVYCLEETEQVIKEIADKHVAKYNNFNIDAVMSVLDLSCMAEYKSNFEAFANELKNTYPLANYALSEANRYNIRQFAQDSYCFGFDGTNSAPIDGLSFLNTVRADASARNTMNISLIDSAIASYDNVVYYNVTCADLIGNANGMSIFVAGGTNTMNQLEEVLTTMFPIEPPRYLEDETNFNTWRSIFMGD